MDPKLKKILSALFILVTFAAVFCIAFGNPELLDAPRKRAVRVSQRIAPEELARLMPVLRLAVRLGAPVSVDTSKTVVMQAALEVGAGGACGGPMRARRGLRDPSRPSTRRR